MSLVLYLAAGIFALLLAFRFRLPIRNRFEAAAVIAFYPIAILALGAVAGWCAVHSRV